MQGVNRVKFKWKLSGEKAERMLIMVSAALVVALALRGGETDMARNEDTLLAGAQVQQSAAVQPGSTAAPKAMQTVTVYYQDGEGYLIPVTTQVEKTDGIARSALSLLVENGENDLLAARMGLKTVVPEGTTFDLDIVDGRARVDMSRESLNCMSAEEEMLMVSAVAQTLHEFSSVKEVSFLFDGQARSKLTHGTDVSGVFKENMLNVETLETFDGTDETASLVRLYFPSQTGRMLVPVTRVVYSDADMVTAMTELCRGPRADSGLAGAVPKGCGLRGVTMKNGVVTVDLTREFWNEVDELDDDETQTLRCILFTIRQFPGVKEVRLQVEGQSVQLPDDLQQTFVNVASEVMAYYPGVIETD